MSRTVSCSRCHREAEAIEKRPPLPGPLGEEVLSRVCSDCWREWEKNEVMVINELRLNFMDPRAAEVLLEKLREFLGLGSGNAV